MHTSLAGPVDITVEKFGSRKSPTGRSNIFRKHPDRRGDEKQCAVGEVYRGLAVWGSLGMAMFGVSWAMSHGLQPERGEPKTENTAGLNQLL